MKRTSSTRKLGVSFKKKGNGKDRRTADAESRTADSTDASVTSLNVTNNLNAVQVKVTKLQANGTNENGYTLQNYANDFTAYAANSKYYALAQNGTDVKAGVAKNDLIAAKGSQVYEFAGKMSVTTEGIDTGIQVGNIIVTIGMDKAS